MASSGPSSLSSLCSGPLGGTGCLSPSPSLCRSQRFVGGAAEAAHHRSGAGGEPLHRVHGRTHERPGCAGRRNRHAHSAQHCGHRSHSGLHHPPALHRHLRGESWARSIRAVLVDPADFIWGTRQDLPLSLMMRTSLGAAGRYLHRGYMEVLQLICTIRFLHVHHLIKSHFQPTAGPPKCWVSQGLGSSFYGH